MNSALSVLIVDENAKMRSMIAEIIKRKASKILECADGMDALGEYSIHHPDWVLMDINLKHMDGLQATEMIRNYFPKAKVMIVSEHNDPYLRKAAHNVGASAFIPKENLIDILENLKV